jgi:hypothetical protein
MARPSDFLTEAEVADARARRMVAEHLQMIEGNPLTAEQREMFDMFERERWSHERRLTHILNLARAVASAQAAE